MFLSSSILCTYSYWHYALTAENKHRCGPANLRIPRFRQMREDETSPTLRGKTCPVWSHLPGVGPVPEDGVAVGHHFGTGLLAKYTHQQHQADEEDHFHLQHHYSETSARIPLRCRVSQSSCTGASTGTGGESHSHVAVCSWRSL